MNRNEEFVKELKKYVPSDSNVDIYLKNNVVYIASKEEEQVPVQFIRCTEEQIQKMKSKFEEGTDINLNLEKEPEQNPVENMIKELEKVSI